MAFPKYYYFLFDLLAFMLNPSLIDDATQQRIDKICRSMEEYAFCNNVFNQNIKGSSADIVALTQITVEQANTNATNTHSFITQLLQKTTDPTEKKALTICENAYRLVMGSFQEAALDFFSKDYEGMLESERKAPRAQASCIDIYNTPTSPPNPLGLRNRQMRILIAMAVAAGTELTSGSISSL